MAVNAGKVVVGGLASGVVLAVLDFLVNGLLMAEQNRAAMDALNPMLAEGMEGTGSMVAFIVIDLLFGILITWTYAAMRPRFGAGPKTAVLAGLQIWLVVLVMFTSMTVMGMWAWSYLAVSTLVFLVMMLVTALVGGMLYKEA